jgi:VWFA-related protein
MRSRLGLYIVSRPLLLVAAIAGSGSAAAQDLPTANSANLVRINLTALDSKGNPVTDLKIGDLTITDDKTARDIGLFRYDGSNIAAGSFNVSAIILDAPSMLPESQNWMRAQLMRFLQVAPSDGRLAVYRKTGGVSEDRSIEVVYDFSDDPAPLRAAAENVSIQRNLATENSYDRLANAADETLSTVGKPEGLRGQNRVRLGELQGSARLQECASNLAALNTLGDHLGQVPGRTNLVWVTHGSSTTSGAEFYCEDLAPPLMERMAQNGVTFYIVDALQSGSRMTSASNSQIEQKNWREGIYTPASSRWMDSVADTTGGRYYRTNDAKTAFVQIDNDLKGAYTLGFQPDPTPDGKWHSLKVKCKRPGVRLRYRQTYLAETHRP